MIIFFIVGILLYVMYPYLLIKKPFVIVGVTPINVPSYEGYTFTKNRSSPAFKKAVKQFQLNKNVIALYIPSSEFTELEKPFSAVMALSNSTIMLPIINFKDDTHWKWERYAKQQFINSYAKKCKVAFLEINPNSLSFLCNTQATSVMFIQNQIVTLDFYAPFANEQMATFTKHIVNDFLSSNNEKFYDEEGSLLIMFGYFLGYIILITILIELCANNIYRIILYNMGIIIAFLVLVYHETYDIPNYKKMTIDNREINLPNLGSNFDLPVQKNVNKQDEKSIIASFSAKNNNDLYPLNIYFYSLNRVGEKTKVGRHSYECYHPHCHDKDYWKVHFEFLKLKLQSASNSEIIEVRPESNVNKVFYLQKSDLDHTDVIATFVLYLHSRVFEISIVKPFKTASDIDAVMRVSEEVSEKILQANKLHSEGNDSTLAAFMALLIAFVAQFFRKTNLFRYS